MCACILEYNLQGLVDQSVQEIQSEQYRINRCMRWPIVKTSFIEFAGLPSRGQQHFVFDQSKLSVGWHTETSPSLGFDLEVTQLQHYEHKHMGKLVRISSNYRKLSNFLQLYSQVTSPRLAPVFMFSSRPQTFLSQA